MKSNSTVTEIQVSYSSLYNHNYNVLYCYILQKVSGLKQRMRHSVQEKLRKSQLRKRVKRAVTSIEQKNVPKMKDAVSKQKNAGVAEVIQRKKGDVVRKCVRLSKKSQE